MEEKHYKIMIIEDEMAIYHSLEKHFMNWGYEVNRIFDFEKVMEEVLQYMPQIILLDITLPYYNGFYWCQKIRSITKIPIIFISSASDNMNMIMAMNMGGDDFISKPFDISVLIAKVGATLRRTYDFNTNTDIIVYGDIYLDVLNATVIYQNQKQELSKNEFKILQILIENKEKIVSRDRLMTRLWETDNYIDENTLSVNVNRLRKKIEQIGLCDIIKTKKGIGYMVAK